MRRVFYIVIIMIFLSSCASVLYPEYTLTKKYPLEIPDLVLEISSDTTGVILKRENKTIMQNFIFSKEQSNYLVIKSVDKNDLVLIRKGDTLVYHKREIYLMNKQHKLVFTKKQ